MNAGLMPRSAKTYRLDDRVTEGLAKVSKRANISATKYLETLLFGHLKEMGAIPMDAEPLGETRGGDRTKPQSEGNEQL